MTTETEATPRKAFEGHDSSVFNAWIRAITDVMLCKGDPSSMLPETMSNLGGLLYELNDAVEQHAADERAHARGLRA